MRLIHHRIWMSAVLLVVLAFSLVYLAAEATKVISLTRIVDMWSLVALQEDRAGVFVEIDPRDFPAAPVPQRGDTLLAVNGVPATRATYFAAFNAATHPGEPVTIRFRRGNDLFETSAQPRTIPDILKAQYVTLYALRVLLTIGLILVGLWAFLRRGEVPAVRWLALFCFTMVMSELMSVRAVADPYATFQIPWRAVVLPAAAIVGALAPILWVRLSFQFRPPGKWYQRPLPLIAAVVTIGGVMALLERTNRTVFTIFPVVYVFLCLAVGFVVLAITYRGTRDTLTRKQLRLVMLGAFPAVIMSGLNVALALRMKPISNLVRLYTLNLYCLALLCIPIAFAYAFGRYRLLEIEGRLRRGTRFAAVNIAVLAAFGGLIYVFGTFLLRGLHIESRTPTFALGLVLALTFAPAQRRLRGALESRFYPERVRQRMLLSDFVDAAGRRLEPERFWPELAHKLSEALRAGSVRVFLRARDGSYVEAPDPAGRYPEPPQAWWDGLEGLAYPIPFDELTGSGRLPFTDAQLRWTKAAPVAVVVPLQGSTQRVGYLLLGPKSDEEDYSHHELDLLRSLAAQIGLTAENLQLVGDRLERQRLEEQLGVARRIQEGLLPATLCVPGLEVAARIRFCLEVAGDFYDVVPLRDGRILFAIGDVAGKGVGAALLMANAQASLRAMKNTGLSLSDTVAEINSLVCQNTPANLFITLFVAVYDPQAEALTYVNAGHNPPLLRSREGPIAQLAEGGLILGIMPEARYAEGHAPLRAGDLLLLYTDGVTEARDGAEEEFGEERLMALLPALAACPVESALDRIEAEVRRFSGREEMEDDFTLLAVRVPRRP